MPRDARQPGMAEQVWRREEWWQMTPELSPVEILECQAKGFL